jgi:hypothetical protein
MRNKFLIFSFLIFAFLGCSKSNQVTLYGYGPTEIFAGKNFNVQPSGESSIWVMVENANESSQVVINENALRGNVYKDGKTITLSIPKELYSQTGHYKMYIVDQRSGDKSNEIYFNVN